MFKFRNKKILSDLYTNHSGSHLTIYLPTKDQSHRQIKKQLAETLFNVERLLQKDKTKEFVNNFLLPIKRLLRDPRILISGNQKGWAIFRTKSSFRLKSIPVHLPNLGVVAKSFHIKPMLRWTLMEENCYVLSLNKSEAILFKASNGAVKQIATLPFFDTLPGGVQRDKLSEFQQKFASLNWIDDRLTDIIADKKAPLILAGVERNIQLFSQLTNHKRLIKEYLSGSFDYESKNELRRALNILFHEVEGKQKSRALNQYQAASRKSKVETDLVEIFQQSLRNGIRKLYIAEDKYIWGNLNAEDGSLMVHPFQKNSLDDDILDDIAELVIKNGAEVVVLPSKDMPDGLSITAILKNRSRKKKVLELESKN